MTPFKSLPITERPRERITTLGSGSLPLEELVAVLIGKGYKGNDVLEVSQRVCDRLVIGHTSYTDLAAIPGVGPAKAAAICAALQLPDSLRQRTNSLELGNPQSIYRACTDIVQEPQEHLVAFYLTVRNTQIARDTIAIGTATASLIHPREVFRPAIIHNASHIVLAHNHPSGDPSASPADREATLRIASVGKNIGIELMDHVICGTQNFVSLKQERPELFGQYAFSRQ